MKNNKIKGILIVAVAAIFGVLAVISAYKRINKDYLNENIFMEKPKNFSQETIIKKGETFVSEDGLLKIENKGGGHKILVEGGDLPYAVWVLKFQNKEKEVEPKSGETIFENGYVITLLEQEFYGAYSKIKIEKPETKELLFGNVLSMKEYESAVAPDGLKLTARINTLHSYDEDNNLTTSLMVELNAEKGNRKETISVYQNEKTEWQGYVFSIKDINPKAPHNFELIVEKQ